MKVDVDALNFVRYELDDGSCPKCHAVHDPVLMQRSWLIPGELRVFGIKCPTCGFHITNEEIARIEQMIAPLVANAVKSFEEWRAFNE